MASGHGWNFACWGVAGSGKTSAIRGESISHRSVYTFNYLCERIGGAPMIQNAQRAAIFSVLLTIIAKVLMSARLTPCIQQFLNEKHAGEAIRAIDV